MQFTTSVSEDEQLARFALEKSKFRPSNNTAKHSLFMPANDNVLSVFRAHELSEEQVFSLGEEFVGAPQGKGILAYASLRASEFRAETLSLVPTIDPHPRHVDVEGWSDHASNLNKAQILAAKSLLILATK